MSDAFQDCPIAAIATAMGSAGICVVRISGAGSLELGDRLVSSARQKPSQRASGTFCYAKIVHPMTHQIIDDVLLLVFRAPHSYTGEDTLEIQGHGGTFPAQRLLDAVLNAGARLAAPGEFTKRAFLNGRLDLTQAEAVCDFIQAKTERAAHAARVQLDGVLGKRIDVLYVRVTNLCAEVEHWLDFDEGELPISFGETIHRNVKVLAGELSELIDSWNASRFLRDGAVVVISGRPNAGKSSLMNALLGRNRAIVYEEPGTTRDVIEDVLSLKGIPIRLVDTAGLRSTENAIEREGIARARDAMEHADLNLYLIDQSVAVSAEDVDALKNLPHESTVVVLTKNDLPHRFDLKAANRFDKVCISTVARTGLESLQSVILKKLGVTYESETVPVVSVRHVTELRQAGASLRQSDRLIDEGSDRLVIVANLLREAAEALGRIVGRVYSDDLLDTIFGRFCVGK